MKPTRNEWLQQAFIDTFINRTYTKQADRVCTGFDGWKDITVTAGDAKCSILLAECKACQAGCKTYIITKAKSNTKGLTFFVLFAVAALLGTVIVANFASSVDAFDDGCGLTTNILGFIAFIMHIVIALIGFCLCIVGIVRALDSTGYALILFGIAAFGFFILVLGALGAVGFMQGNGLLVGIATIVLGIMAYLLLIFGIILGVCSGIFMESAQVSYDSNFKKLRSTLSKGDKNFCRLDKANCLKITQGSTAVLVRTGSDVYHSPKALWDKQYLMLQDEGALLDTQLAKADIKAGDCSMKGVDAFKGCKSEAICVACNIFDTASYSNYLKMAKTYTTAEPYAYEGFSVRDIWARLNAEAKSTATGTAKTKATAALDTWLEVNTTRMAFNRSQAATIKRNSNTELLLDGTPKATEGSITKTMATCELELQKKAKETTCKADQDCKSCENFRFAGNNRANGKHTSKAATMKKCYKYMQSLAKTQFSGRADCKPTVSSAACRSRFTGSVPFKLSTGQTGAAKTACNTALKNKIFDLIYPFVKGATSTDSAFCDYADDACRQKVKEVMESKNVALMIAGTIFELFELIILYVTYRGVIVFFSGDDDDDDDDDSD